MPLVVPTDKPGDESQDCENRDGQKTGLGFGHLLPFIKAPSGEAEHQYKE
jgi:hypothetical protein